MRWTLLLNGKLVGREADGCPADDATLELDVACVVGETDLPTAVHEIARLLAHL